MLHQSRSRMQLCRSGSAASWQPSWRRRRHHHRLPGRRPLQRLAPGLLPLRSLQLRRQQSCTRSRRRLFSPHQRRVQLRRQQPPPCQSWEPLRRHWQSLQEQLPPGQAARCCQQRLLQTLSLHLLVCLAHRCWQLLHRCSSLLRQEVQPLVWSVHKRRTRPKERSVRFQTWGAAAVLPLWQRRRSEVRQLPQGRPLLWSEVSPAPLGT
jgi:hypothetical protein